jgi:hypothetical protein
MGACLQAPIRAHTFYLQLLANRVAAAGTTRASLGVVFLPGFVGFVFAAKYPQVLGQRSYSNKSYQAKSGTG